MIKETAHTRTERVNSTFTATIVILSIVALAATINVWLLWEAFK